MKEKVKYFICYSSENAALVANLMNHLTAHLNLSKDYTFEGWSDGDIILGTDWHERIQRAIRDCDMGFLLVSPSFFSSEYIKEHELPHFLTKSPQGITIHKPIVPVGIQHLNLNGDLRGVEKTQIYRYQLRPGSRMRFYDECKTKTDKNHFAAALANKIITKINSMRHEATR